ISDILTSSCCGVLVLGTLTGSASPTHWGWTVGAGFEYALLPNLSALVEYDYLDFGTRRDFFSCLGVTFTGSFACGFTAGAGIHPTFPLDIRQQIHAIKLGLNWRFNWGKAPWGKGPVVARY